MLPFNTLPILRNGLLRYGLVLMLLGIGLSTFSQKITEKNGQTFHIRKAGDTYAPETVVQTFEGADLRFHRFRSVPNILLLDDGTEIEVLSAETLAAAGYGLNVSQYREAYPEKHLPSLFSIQKYILLEHRPSRTPDK